MHLLIVLIEEVVVIDNFGVFGCTSKLVRVACSSSCRNSSKNGSSDIVAIFLLWLVAAAVEILNSIVCARPRMA